MKDLAGKVAFITGAASGIGFALAKAFGKAGMKVALADIDGAEVTKAADELKRLGVEALSVELDVADERAWAPAADRAESTLGPIQVLCNNAGVGSWSGPAETLPLDVWRWVMGVNLDAHLFSLRTFLTRMKARGDEGHIVHTASMAGLVVFPGILPYTVSKAAVIGMAEALRAELRGTSIGNSVLLPGVVRTNILETGRRARPPGLSAPENDDHAQAMKEMLASGMDPNFVAEQVVAAVRANTFYIFSHVEWKPQVAERTSEMLAAFGLSADPDHKGSFVGLSATAADQSGKTQ